MKMRLVFGVLLTAYAGYSIIAGNILGKLSAKMLWPAAISHAPTCSPALNPDLNNDGRLNIFDSLIVVRSLGITPKDPRYRPQADTDCNGLIGHKDLDFVTDNQQKSYAIKPIVKGALYLPIIEQLTTDKDHILHFQTEFISQNKIPFSIILIQAVKPEQSLLLSPQHNETIKAEQVHKRSLKTKISAQKAGSYQLVTTATIPESGQRFSRVTQIVVAEPKKKDWTLSLAVAQLFDSKPSNIDAVASVSIHGKGLSDIEQVVIHDAQHKQSWPLIRRNPSQYDGHLTLENSAYGTCFTLTATAIADNQTFTSPSRRLCLSDKRLSKGRTHLSLYVHPDTLTDLPNASIMAEASIIGPRQNKFTRMEVYSRDRKYRWQLPQQRSGFFQGRIDLSNAYYGQCFEFIATAFDNGGETLNSFFMQAICLRDQYGRPVIQGFQEKTHTIE